MYSARVSSRTSKQKTWLGWATYLVILVLSICQPVSLLMCFSLCVVDWKTWSILAQCREERENERARRLVILSGKKKHLKQSHVTIYSSLSVSYADYLRHSQVHISEDYFSSAVPLVEQESVCSIHNVCIGISTTTATNGARTEWAHRLWVVE